ncbi:MAG: SUMF1/EgtB/PvdO family nonheme iron enzyme [Planctomycetes bacterium]|nr:SUMF1/EgtB/PvdO family nonheme iron enzyme [Planctomycetota bacterium]
MSHSPRAFSPDALRAFAELTARGEASADELEAAALEHPEIAEELRELHRMRVRAEGLLRGLLDAPSVVRSALSSLEGVEHRADDEARRALDELATLRASGARYEDEGEVARGGMSRVLRVRDRALGRTLAMKVVRERAGFLPRFLAEARLTGRLEHPGIIPVHDLGVDERGQAYFTMPLVRGRTLADVIDLARRGEDGWSEARVLEVLLKVCDTVAYAHSLGVVHRDLKPENVLVGRFGVVYVVDWGLARIDGEQEAPAIGGGELDDPLATQHTEAGAVLGTPAYMAPEQAEGRHHDIDARTDVYALGAILYRYLTGVAPYCDGERKPGSRAVIAAARAGPPREVEALAREAVPELASICKQAMQRESERRYASIQAFADDLRARTRGRVVRAHAHGPWIELVKWVRRNRALAGALAGVVLVAIVGAIVVFELQRRREEDLRVSAERVRFEADRNAPAALSAEANELWPAVPELVPRMDEWLARARTLAGRRETLARELDELRRRGRVSSEEGTRVKRLRAALDAELQAAHSEVEGHAQDLVEFDTIAQGIGARQGHEYASARLDRALERTRRIEQRLAGLVDWTFATPSEQQHHDALDGLLVELEAFLDPHAGPLASVEGRRELALRLRAASESTLAAAWSRAIDEIADPARCPLYRGLRLEPQIGLEPLRRDPRSGLWEFWHVASGVRPILGPDDEWLVGEKTGIVLVLLPTGTFRMGKTADSPLPGEAIVEGDGIVGVVRDVALDAFFLSKFEMTQAQWFAAMEENPAYFHVGSTFDYACEKTTYTWTHPVESVSWIDANEALRRIGLVLPTEAQLEYGARGGTIGRWSLPEVPWCFVGGLNAGNYPGVGSVDSSWTFSPYDGAMRTARVGTLPPNPWGLYEVHGNVSEWARDVFWSKLIWPMREGDGLHLAPESDLRSVRGGNNQHFLRETCSWSREDQAPEFRSWGIGVRPSRRLDRR